MRARLLVVVITLACGGEAKSPDASATGAREVIGTAPAAIQGLPSVVMLDPIPSHPAHPPAEAAVLDQFGLAFVPKLLVAQVAQVVEFRNSEEVEHSVRVTDLAGDSTVFNVSMPSGARYAHTFTRTGGYGVKCDIHPGMTAYILVVSARYATVATAAGDFSMADVPTGSYTLSVWSVDPARRRTRTVEVLPGRTVLGLYPVP